MDCEALVTLEIKQGATFYQEVFYKDENGDPVDITGLKAKMEIRPSYSSSQIIATLTTENGRISIDGDAGKVAVNIPAATTLGYTGGPLTWVFDLFLINDGTSEVTPLLSGNICLIPTVNL